MDNLTKKQRSYNMSLIKSRWTKPEKAVHNYLKGMKIKHKMHPELKGSPDLILTESNTAIFIQGCFWHKCPKCYKEPKSRKSYWINKIKNNVSRDKRNERVLKSFGYKVLKVWEHDVNKEFNKVADKISLEAV